jgi:hypothetical protein
MSPSQDETGGNKMRTRKSNRKHDDRIHLWVIDLDTGERVKDLGLCLTDCPGRALQMFLNTEKIEPWETIEWEWNK